MARLLATLSRQDTQFLRLLFSLSDEELINGGKISFSLSLLIESASANDSMFASSGAESDLSSDHDRHIKELPLPIIVLNKRKDAHGASFGMAAVDIAEYLAVSTNY